MKKITFLLLIAVFSFAINSCENDAPLTEDLNYISFESTSSVFPVGLEGATEQAVMVYTTNKTNSARTFTVTVDLDASTADPASYTVPATVTIPSNANAGEILISFTNLNIGVGGKSLVLKLGKEENLYTSEDIELSVFLDCPGQETFIDVALDAYGSEASWELLDATGGTVTSGSGYSDGDTGASLSLCLANGTYTFNVYDSYGDGGTTVEVTKDNVVIMSILGSSYATEASDTFVIE